MDWSKSKNILIIAFIITNLILVVTFINNSMNAKAYVSESYDVKNRLIEKNITINTDIPSEIPSMGLLQLEYQFYPREKDKINLANKFLNDYSIEYGPGSVSFISDSETLKIENDREIKYFANNSKKKYNNIEENLNEIVEEFLSKRDFEITDYVLTDKKEENGIYTVEYTKKYKNTIIERSYMKFTIDSSGVISFDRLWLNLGGEKVGKINIRPATDSLLKLLSNEKVYGKTITDMRHCYYFDPKNQNIANFDNPKSGDAIPAWKVKFSDGTVEYLYEN